MFGGIERNPLTALLIERAGPHGLYLHKLLAISVYGAAIYRLPPLYQKSLYLTAIGISLMVIINNAVVIMTI